MSAGGSSKLRVALIGCGRIAETHLEALAAVPGCELAGVADTRLEAARDAAERFATRAFGGPGELLAEAEPEAAIVCTPPSTHPAIAGACLDRGVHVLCEKPLAISCRQAEGLVARAEGANRLLMMASKFRYVEDVIEAKRIIDERRLGDVVLYENVFCSHVDMQGRWNARREISGGGVLIDNGTHSVDIARFLLGPIVKVQAEGGQRLQGLEVEDTCRLYLRAAGGAMGVVDLSWSINKERDAYIEVFGSRGVLSIGWSGSRYRAGDEGDWIPFGGGYDKRAAFERQLANFAGAIRGSEKPLITAEDSLESVRVIDAAYRSMEDDNWVQVGEQLAAGSGGAA